MTSVQATQLINAIITQPTAEQAAQYAQTNVDALLSATCYRILEQMVREEFEHNGVSHRYHALQKLKDYRSALFRRRLDLSDDLNSQEPLPQLIVMQDRAFDRWWKVLDYERSSAQLANQVDENVALDDLNIFRLLRSINERLYIVATMTITTHPGENEIQKCQTILADCQRLLTQSQPHYYKSDAITHNVNTRKAHALKYLARIYDAQGNAEQAQGFYQKAVDAFLAVNDKSTSYDCQADIAWALSRHKGNHDAAITIFHEIMEKAVDTVFEQIKYRIELGELYSDIGDYYQAERELGSVEKSLDALKLANPTGQKIAHSLFDALMPSPEQSDEFITLGTLHILYWRLYTIFERVYDKWGNDKKVAEYLDQLEQMEGTIKDGNQLNQEFSQHMLAKLALLMQASHVTAEEVLDLEASMKYHNMMLRYLQNAERFLKHI